MLPADHKPKQTQIFAAEKIIADISTGVYRSPAAALKELVSNAYDADADNVFITTDAPKFRTLTIRDDGNGMDIKKFLHVIKHIGGSTKRIDKEESDRGRKLIGRIGIGLMAVAQLGSRFYVSSTVRGSKTRFIAEVNLDPYHKDDAALRSMEKVDGEQQVQIGAVKYVDDIPEREDSHFTVITVPDAKKGLISDLTSAVRKAVGAQEQLSIVKTRIEKIEDLIRVVRNSRRADLNLDGYYYMLWELSMLAPVNYSCIPPFVAQDRKIVDLEELRFPRIKDFAVFVDGIELKRPQLFPNQIAVNYSSPDPKVYPLEFDREIAGRRLRFTGYIYSQQPNIEPEELKGIHIRIRDVGIGRYDKSWLGYPLDEGFKFGQVSGEVYIQDGLEPALNIDRDSFRETDVHYQALRAYLWNILKTKVFPDFKSRGNRYRIQRKTKEQKSADKKFDAQLSKLPAPVGAAVTHVQPAKMKSIGLRLAPWLSYESSGLLIEKDGWKKFAQSHGLVKKEAQARFQRIARILASSELLSDVNENELSPLLAAIAEALR